jgi:GR25 family glycosyltransferase involved in LPS biosynthesis
MKFFIIHLARAEQRKSNVERLRKIVPGDAEVIDAVDARNLSEDEIRKVSDGGRIFPPYPFSLRPSEIACFMSHRKAWDLIARGDDAGAFILEDDVVLTEPEFGRAIALSQTHAGEEDFVRFPYKKREKPSRVVAKDGATCLFEPSVCGLGMQAQFVGRSAAVRLLKATERFDRPVDTLLQMTWLTGQIGLSVSPSGVREISQDIGGSTIGERKSISGKLYREIARPSYRFALWVALRLKAL